MEGICTVSGIRLKTDCLEEQDHDDRENYDSKHNNIFSTFYYNLIFFLPRMKIIVPAAAMIRTAATVLTQYSLPRSGFPLL